MRVWGPKLGVCKHVFSGYGFHEGAITALASHPTDANLLLTGVWSVARPVAPWSCLGCRKKPPVL